MRRIAADGLHERLLYGKWLGRRGENQVAQLNEDDQKHPNLWCIDCAPVVVLLKSQRAAIKSDL